MIFVPMEGNWLFSPKNILGTDTASKSNTVIVEVDVDVYDIHTTV